MNCIGFITWNVNPDLIHAGTFSIRWYGFFYAVAFILSFNIIKNLYKKEKLPFNEVERLAFYVLGGTLAGGRIGELLLHHTGWYMQHPGDILKIWEGGLSPHGAALGILAALYFFTRKKNSQPYLKTSDKVALIVPLCSFFIRAGNLMNAEAFGKATTLAWGFKFMRNIKNKGLPADEVIPHHPTQIYEGIIFLALFFIFKTAYHKWQYTVKPGFYTGLCMLCIFSVNFFMAFLKDGLVPADAWFMANTGLTIGQLLSVPFMAAGLVLMAGGLPRQNKMMLAS